MMINETLKAPNALQLSEKNHDDTSVPSDGLILGSPLETATDLYKDIQRDYGSSVTGHPYYKVSSHTHLNYTHNSSVVYSGMVWLL